MNIRSSAAKAWRKNARRAGSALLLILGCVALMTILIISFFASARNEFSTSSFYAKGVNTKLLSENVINLVETQLREGARSTDIVSKASVAWASQPGMIRTYDTSGNPYKYFKLYSWDNMVGTGQFNETLAAETPPTGASGWASQPNLYTDLNEPVNGIYPVIDPGALGSVEGFSFTTQTDTSNTLSMPVKWLYILKDGTTTLATSAGVGTSVKVTGASATNPIIGRVAFWTDDETSKVNINTASEGTFWDMPIGSNIREHGLMGNGGDAGPGDVGYADTLPAAGEFQATPGHPATTSLSAVFGYGTNNILPVTGLEGPVSYPLMPGATANYQSSFSPYFSTTPRYQSGGSLGGSQSPSTATVFAAPGYRLYDSVDELAFDPGRVSMNGANNNSYGGLTLYSAATPSGRLAEAKLTPAIIEQRRFFISAHSRAPEETLFGTPRISLWPLQTSVSDPTNGTVNSRTAKDNLLAFCSTINNQPYFFQRATYFQNQANSGSAVIQYPATLASSTSSTMDFSGSAGVIGSPTTTLQTGAARNENLYAYLQAMTGGLGVTGSGGIPGFGGNFLAKYPGGVGSPATDRDQILTEMFDLIRSGINTFDISTGVYPHYTYTPFNATQTYGQPVGAGSTVPIKIATQGGTSANTYGIGRIYNIGELSIVFMASAIDLNDGSRTGGVITGAGSLDPSTNPTANTSGLPLFPPAAYYVSPPRRMSIGGNLPWANEEDYPPSGFRVYLYYDQTAKAYGTYYVTQDPTNPAPSPKPYVYTIPPNTTTPLDITSANAAIPVPIFCYWDRNSPGAYGSYFLAPPQDKTNGGKLFICPSPGITVYNGTNYGSFLAPGTLQPLPNSAVTIADPQTTAVQAFVLFRPFSAMPGNPSYSPNVRVRISNLNQLSLTVPGATGTSLGFNPGSQGVAVINSWNNALSSTDGGLWEGVLDHATADIITGANTGSPACDDNSVSVPWQNDGTAPSTLIASPANYNYPFISKPVTFPANTAAYPSPFGGQDPDPFPASNPTNTFQLKPTAAIPPPGPSQIHYAIVGTQYAGSQMTLNGAQLQIDVIDGVTTDISKAQPIETLQINVPTMTLPVPTIEMANGRPYCGNEGEALGNPYNNQGGPRVPGYVMGSGTTGPGSPNSNPAYQGPPGYVGAPAGYPYPALSPLNYYWQLPYDPRNIVLRFAHGGDVSRVINRGDIVRSFVINPGSKVAGDMRMLAANPIQPTLKYPNDTTSIFDALGSFGTYSSTSSTAGPAIDGSVQSMFIKQLDSLLTDSGNGRYGYNLIQTSESLLIGNQTASPIIPAIPIGAASFTAGNYGMQISSGQLFPGEHYSGETAPVVTPELTGAFMDPVSKTIPGDWSLGIGNDPDGGFVVKPDEGENQIGYSSPYYSTNMGNQDMSVQQISYSPNRQVPSAIIFGTLPSRVMAGVPWCTLLFCPNPAANDNGSNSVASIHPGFGQGAGTDIVSNASVAWASQPGMIRTYDNTGNPFKYFKLYSWDNMVGNLQGGATFAETNPGEAPPTGSTGWATQPNIYTDLNEPVNGIYPIVDPNAMNNVEGFSFTSAGQSSGSSNTLPMPVKWLYILRNGQTTTGVQSGTGTKVSIAGASATNPVVGRVAFWTDDETCKVNINTASEGTFWDTPYGAGSEEEGVPGATVPPYGFATSAPSQFEFQRIPGHPATTSLSAVFGYNAAPLKDTSLDNALLVWPLTTAEYTATFAPYYTLTPRALPGGSMGGAQQSVTTFNPLAYRLYDSVDELSLDPYRLTLGVSDANLYPAANGASPTGRTSLPITPAIIEQRRFFLTAHSRAPEETLSGTPRISLWPLETDPTARTAKDNLLAFCSTIGGQPYYYQRAQWFQNQPNSMAGATTSTNPSSQSPIADFPAAPTPPGAVASKTGIDRNEDIYGYLQALTGRQIPGFGGDFFDKYPGGKDGAGNPVSDRDEILTEMFDLIRSGVNTFSVAQNVYPHYTATPFTANGGTQTNGGTGSSIPISIPSNFTHGMGRTYNIAEVSLVFMAAAIDVSGAPAGTLDSPTTYTPPGSVYYPGIGQVGGTTISFVVPAKPRRMSIGPGLPWACEVDYPNLPSAVTPQAPANFVYWDPSQAGSGYHLCYEDTDSTSPTYKFLLQTGSSPKQQIPNNASLIGDPQTTAVQAFLLLRPYSGLPGPPAFAPNLRVRITNLDQLSVQFPLNGNSKVYNLGFPGASGAVTICSLSNIYSSSGESTPDGGLQALSFPATVAGVPGAPGLNDGSSLINYAYPFAGTKVYLTDATGTTTIPSYPSPYGGQDPANSTTWENQLAGYNAPPGLSPPTTTNPPVGSLQGQIHLTKLNGGGTPAIIGYPGSSMVLNAGSPYGVTLKIEVLGGVDPNNPHAPDATTPVLSTCYVNIPSVTLPIPTVEMANGLLYAGSEPYTTGAHFNNNSGPRIPSYGTVQTFPVGQANQFTQNTQSPLAKAPYTSPGGSTYTFSALDYYWQLPDTKSGDPTYGRGAIPDMSPLDIQSRFTDQSLAINRGDVVRSWEVNPNSSVGGDMRLLALNPIRSTSEATDSSTDLYAPLGSQRLSDNTYVALPTQGPWTNPWIKQLHSLIADSGNGRSNLNLVQTSQQMLADGLPLPATTPTLYCTVPIGSDGSSQPYNSMVMPSTGPGMYESSGALFTDSSLSDPLNLGHLEHYTSWCSPDVTPEQQGTFMDVAGKHYLGDWTLTPGADGDGPVFSKPDEGEQVAAAETYSIPYYSTNSGNLDLGDTVLSYSPNRQVPSPIVFGGLLSRPFGSLPGGSQKGVPWCTLLFCPNPAANDDPNYPHPGFGVGSNTGAGCPGPEDYPPYSTPPDHLLLDDYWMPVVEPYAISEPFSTAGKVNMNYAMVPFGEYIHRSTALHAVLKSTRILAVPTLANDGSGVQYSGSTGFIQPTNVSPAGGSWPSFKTTYLHTSSAYGSGADFSNRYGINLSATIDDANSAFQVRFVSFKDIFRSATEICNVFLVPKKVPGRTYYSSQAGTAPAPPTDASYASMTAWWKNFKMTGDNGRESPYSQIYPRLTTKSNSYQVHMRVQVLTQTPADVQAGTFDTGAGDSVTGEYRGSTTIERYLDSNQSNLPDFATTFPGAPTGSTSTVDNYVRYRVVGVHSFSP